VAEKLPSYLHFYQNHKEFVHSLGKKLRWVTLANLCTVKYFWSGFHNDYNIKYRPLAHSKSSPLIFLDVLHLCGQPVCTLKFFDIFRLYRLADNVHAIYMWFYS
jgi:hypothetical protein